MNRRQPWLFGLAGLGLVLAAPAQASPAFLDGAFMVAKRERGNEIRQDQRDARQEERRASRREAERDQPQGYGYGYERRQQEQFEQDSRPRGRR